MATGVLLSERELAVLGQKLDALSDKHDKLIGLATKTNGRVTKLERAEIERDAKFATWVKAIKYLSPIISLLVFLFIIGLIMLVADPEKAAAMFKAIS